MSAATGQIVGAELCKIFGLERVKSMKIELHLDLPVLFHVEQYMDAEHADGFIEVMRRFELVERPVFDLIGHIDQMADAAKSEINYMTDLAHCRLEVIYRNQLNEMRGL
jgi:hypothetical protein